MSIFGKIVSAIFGHAKAAEAAPAPGGTAGAAPAGGGTAGTAPAGGGASAGAAPAPRAPTAAATPAPAAGAAQPLSQVDVAAVLTALAAKNKEKLDWRRSIVDLMKLLDLDSSLAARKELAQELHYTGDMNDSASMNVWLQKQVMQKLAENGGKVPDDLKK